MTVIDLTALGQRAKHAARLLNRATTDQKNALILHIAAALEAHTPAILEANARDLEIARQQGKPETLIRDRFDLASRMAGMIADVRKVATLFDPVGEVFEDRTLASGLHVQRRRTPLGVLGVIYEARPNVTVDVAVLALKTNNAVVLRGGSEVVHSNRALTALIREALIAFDQPGCLPVDAVQMIDETDRAYVEAMLKLDRYIDLIIPRGGESLHRFCREHATIPVVTGGLGIVHLYADASADLDAALPVIHNAKTQRPSVCNALDTLLVHEAIAADLLPRVVDDLGAAGVVFKADPAAYALVGDDERVTPAGEVDFDTEWMALTLGLKVVSGLDAAIDHIHAHSTFHSDGILSRTGEHIDRFVQEIDAAAVFVNASTRFNDGSALGLGAEIAVSTQKLHARGPMALEALTTYKWVVTGDGHIRS